MANDELRLEQVDALLNKIGSLDGYFTVSAREDGYYLTVVPPQDQGKPVSDATIVAHLDNRRVTGYDRASILRAIKDGHGNPVKIAEMPAEKAEPEIRVNVSRDRLEALLEINIPANGRLPEIEEVIEAIQQAEIRYGVDYEAVEKACQNPGVRVTCARGLPPQDGNDAYLQHHVDFSMQGKPKEMANGKVDFKNLDTFIKVDQGALLLEKISASPGRPGIDVLGQRLQPKHGQDILLPVGKNVQLVDCSKVIAAIAGQVMLEERKISVIPVIEVNGDVDLSTGNIDFVGNVIVRGSVQSGFSVKAGGDVEVIGAISGGIVEGKDIIVRMGIIGMQNGYVRAVQDLNAKFIQNAVASAGRDVLVSDGIVNAQISAGRNVRVEGGNGSIVGGMVSAGEEIYARTVGNALATGTDLRVGVNPALREEYQHLCKEAKNAEKNLDSVRKSLRLLQSMDRNHMSADKKEKLLKLTQTQFHLMGQVQTMQQRITEIDISFESMRYGRIKVFERISAGTRLSIGSMIKPLRDDLRYVKFYVADGEIKFTNLA